MMKAYLEDYQSIKIISDQKININDLFFVNCDISLKIDSEIYQNNEYSYYVSTSKDILPHIDYYLSINNESVYLSLGKITRSLSFDNRCYYDGPLGVEYHLDYSIFRLWTPVSKEVILVLDNKEYSMHYLNNHWEIKIDGNFHLKSYYYKVRINEEFIDSLDPYGISAIKNRNYVIDLNQTYQMHQYSLDKYNDIIYEVHLKDLSYPSKSYYLGAIDKISYLKTLGINAIQVMPVNLFYGIDIDNPDKLYNWGYNPLEYMSLTSWYAGSIDPITPINEFKEMIDKYHANGIKINLDVVFNHVYKDSMFSYGKIVPGYVFRCDEIGFLTNGSLCGNDLKTESLMIRRLIVDTLRYFVKEYYIDGFRFDLMGLIDIYTLQEIEKELQKLNSSISLYGEGWIMKSEIDSKLLGNMNNKESIKNYSFFNDTFRNTLLGNQFSLEKGYLLGKSLSSTKLLSIIKADNLKNQSVNYIECHDNYTLNDYLELNKIKDISIKKDILKLALGLIIISFGKSLIHLGMERGRSKKLSNNSYNLDMSYNSVDLNNKEYDDVYDYLKSIIKYKHQIDYDNIKIVRGSYLRFISNNIEWLIKNDYEEYSFNNQLINTPGVFYQEIK